MNMVHWLKFQTGLIQVNIIIWKFRLLLNSFYTILIRLNTDNLNAVEKSHECMEKSVCLMCKSNTITVVLNYDYWTLGKYSM